MKRIKITAALVLCVASLTSLSACKRTSPLPRPIMGIDTIVSVKDFEEPEHGQRDAAVTAAKGANDFAFRLSAALLKSVGDENFVCSPYSAWLPLAALVNATDEAHKPALLSALGASGITAEDMNLASSRMLYDLTKQQSRDYDNYYNPLKIVNAIFVDQNARLKRDFAQTFADYYRGTAINVDFKSPDAVAAVNQWASNNTDGLITDIIQKFDPDTVAAVANAVYFYDGWHWEFDARYTKGDTFHAPGGDTTAMFMVREGDEQPYYEDENVQAMPLYFKAGGGMLIILPKSGTATELLGSMTSEYLEKIQSDRELLTGKLLLPRFKIESGVMNLKDALTALGVPLFDEDAAPLTGGLVERNTPVWLSAAVQKAFIEVDEKGTTAAAVTILPAVDGLMPEPTEPFEMICDKPFAFILFERTSDAGDQILFTGVVNKP